jgi:hypothetical protein
MFYFLRPSFLIYAGDLGEIRNQSNKPLHILCMYEFQINMAQFMYELQVYVCKNKNKEVFGVLLGQTT